MLNNRQYSLDSQVVTAPTEEFLTDFDLRCSTERIGRFMAGFDLSAGVASLAEGLERA